MIDMQQRIQRAAESILDNEALTTNLENAAAEVLINWGVILAQEIANQTIEMDEAQAEEAMYRPMRALRKMLRTASKWAVNPQEMYLGRVLKQASIVYGSGFANPSDEEQIAFMTQIPAAPRERLIELQRFVEGKGVDLIGG